MSLLAIWGWSERRTHPRAMLCCKRQSIEGEDGPRAAHKLINYSFCKDLDRPEMTRLWFRQLSVRPDKGHRNSPSQTKHNQLSGASERVYYFPSFPD